jgi:hypothetical protein
MEAYHYVDHTHCWDKENPPCGIKGKHRCCLCLKPVPNQPQNNQWEKSKWVVLEDDDCVHVLPETDIKPHGFPNTEGTKADLSDTDCPCKPNIDFSGTKPIVVHKSFEDTERVNKAIQSYEK